MKKHGIYIINLYLKEFLKSEGINFDLKLQFLLVVLSDLNYKDLSESSFIYHLPKIFGSRIIKLNRYVEDNYHRKMKLINYVVLINN